MTALDGMQVVLVDDHPALRKGLEAVLRARGVRVIGTAERAAGVVEMVRRRRPDVTVVDLGLPDESGAALCRGLLADDPEAAVLVYTGVADLDLLADAMTCGARGHVLKCTAPERLLEALASVAQGGIYLDPALDRLLAGSEASGPGPVLTPREREVLQLLADGLNGEQVAQRLFISSETVRTHVRNAMEKLDAQTRAHAVVVALRRGEIELARVAA